jgi:feruloyl-CoA synthase
LIEQTVRNIGEISPTIYFNVPAGFAALLPYLEGDKSIAKAFFARLRLIFYAGAALPQDLWSRLEDVSVRTIGKRVPMTSFWGATETAPAVTAAHFPLERAGVIGVPIPGIELKLLPSNDRLEIRVKGPHVTPGYWGSRELTADAFDEEGYYKIGDAVCFADPQDPARGLVYDGRIAEDFKLSSGSWVRVGALRIAVLAAASPVLQDAVVAGEGRDFVGIMAWLNRAGCAQVVGQGTTATLKELAVHPAIHAHVREALTSWNVRNGGATTRVQSVLLLTDMPSIDSGEITDKGYVNQRAVLDNRAEAMRVLLGDEDHPNLVIVED